MLNRPGEARGWFARPAAVLLGLVIGAVLFGVLFPWFPGAAGMREGDASRWTLSAPRDLSYESGILTEIARDEAAEAIADVQRRDDSIAETQIAELSRQLAQVERARAATLSDSARESQIRAATGGSSRMRRSSSSPRSRTRTSARSATRRATSSGGCSPAASPLPGWRPHASRSPSCSR